MKKNSNNGLSGISRWVVARIFGLLLILIGVYLSVSLYNFPNEHSYYGYETSENLPIITGYLGGYLAGTLLNYIDVSSYLIPALCFIWGIKLLTTIKIHLKILRSLGIVISIIFISSLYNEFSLYKNIIGNLLFETYLLKFFEGIDSNLIILIKIVGILLIIPIVLFSLSINNSYLIRLSKIIFKIIKLIFKILFNTLSFLSKGISKSKPKPDIHRHDPALKIKKEKVKIEPTINQRKKITKIDINQGSLEFEKNMNYELPGLDLLKVQPKESQPAVETNKELQIKAKQLEEVLNQFGIQGKIKDVRPGPIVTMYELEPSAGTVSSRIVNLADDIARSVSALSARISSQPGRNIIGIELPNKNRVPVYLSELLLDKNYQNNKNNLILALGKDILGNPTIADLEKMPHLLIAGTTGSGKSVGLNSMIMSLLFKLKPSECRLILIDPKMLEFSVYEDIPHLMTPVVTDPHKAIVALKWAVKEMENRYKLMNHIGVKNISSYNIKINNMINKGTKMYREITTGIDPDTRQPITEKKEIPNEIFPYIVIVIDEMADLMMVARKDIEQTIQRLAQMARAAGIHLIMATQRPSVDVITGTIKANFPSRISYHVASKFDSRTIINEMGAEQLLGNGDMLFMENAGKTVRLHGGYVSESEIEAVTKFIKTQSKPDFSKNITSEEELSADLSGFASNNEVVDDLYEKAVELVLMEQKASTSFVQRHLQIGYNRAARIIEQMEKEGLISEGDHIGRRQVLKNNV